MPRDDQSKSGSAASGAVGRTYHGEMSPPITTAEAVAKTQARRAEYAGSPEAIPIHVYFVVKGHQNPILQASMLAYTDIRVATVEAFDEIFDKHHSLPAADPPKPAAPVAPATPSKSAEHSDLPKLPEPEVKHL